MYDLFNPIPEAVLEQARKPPGQIKLRDIQREAIDAILGFYGRGMVRQLAVASTGYGKTVLMSALPTFMPELYKSSMLVLVHRDSLVRQTVAKFRRYNPNARIGIEKAEEYAPRGCDLVVASVQTVGRGDGHRMDRLLSTYDFGIVVVDEAHHAKPGGQYDTALAKLHLGADASQVSLTRSGLPRLSLGVTATPNRHDGIGLSHFYDEIVYEAQLDLLVREGYLCEPVVYTIETGKDLSGVQSRRGDLVQKQLSEAIHGDVDRNNLVVSGYLEYCEGKTAIAFCVDKEHSRELAATFESAGVPAASITEDTTSAERAILFEKHNAREIMVLCSVDVLSEGYDGRVDAALMARPTKSKSRYTQCAGRALRTDPPDLGNAPTRELRLEGIENSRKKNAIILDFLDDGHDLVHAASLYGGAPKYKAKGEKIFTEVRQAIDEAIEKSPLNEAAIRASASFEQIEVEARRRDVLALAKSYHSLGDKTDLKWMQVGDDAYQIEVPTLKSEPRKLVRIETDAVGRYYATSITPPRVEAGERIAARRERFAEPSFELSALLAACDSKIKQENPAADKLLKKRQPWHMHKPSAGQMSYLKRLGVDTSEVRSKGRASDLIVAANALREM